MNAIYVTQEGLVKMNEEINELKARRPQIAARIGEAKEQGDLSENAEYQAARDEQSMVESRILELEEQLKNAVVIKHKESDTVRIGSQVELELNLNGEKSKVSYTIVGSNEADPTNGKISNESPVAIAIIGKSVGDTAIVRAPKGNFEYTIKKLN